MNICLEQRQTEDYSPDAHWKERARVEEPGKAVEFLAQYPTPELIRRLVVMNSLDSRTSGDHRGRQSTYFEGHARRALLKIKERADWPELVNDSLIKFPELESVRSELLELRVSEIGTYAQKSEALLDLKHAVKQRVLVPMQLGLTEYPKGDLKLSEYIHDRRVYITDADIVDVIKRTHTSQNFDGNELSELPFGFTSDRKKDIEEIFNRVDLTAEQRDQELARIKRILVLGKSVRGTDLIDDRFKPSDNTRTLVAQLLSADLTDEQLISAVQLIANTQLPVSVFLRDGSMRVQVLQRASMVNTTLVKEGLIKPELGRRIPRELAELSVYLIDAKLTEDQMAITARNIAEFCTAIGDTKGNAYFDYEMKAFAIKEYFSKLVNDLQDPQQLDNLFNSLVVYKPDAIKTLNLADWKAIFGSDGVRRYAEADPKRFIMQGTKQDWRVLFGDEVMNRFFRALPEDNDERRNAFLHNAYDRTSDFMDYLVDRMKLKFSAETVRMAGEYIELFGFSKSNMIVQYFDALTQLENGSIAELPRQMRDIGLTNKAEFLKSISLMKDKMYGEEPLLDLSDLNLYELEMLKIMTGKASHRFDVHRLTFTEIVSDFQKDHERGLVKDVPEGYESITLSSDNIELHLDISPYVDTVRELALEIQKGVNFENESGAIQSAAQSLLRNKLATLKTLRDSADPQRQSALEAESTRYQAYLDSISSLTTEELTSDVLFRRLIAIKAGKSDRVELGRLIQATILARLYEVEPGFRELMGELSELRNETAPIKPENILKLKDFIKDPLKEHVLKFGSDGEMMKYWSLETRQAIKEHRDNLREIFEPYYGRLNEGVSRMELTKTASRATIQAIPDRGFIGEMSGYLADVCYTAEYPLLKGRDVVPYKFVRRATAGGTPEFIGSVLVFEVATETGENALLVRGFDIPHEESYDISTLIETFIDGLSDTALKRGKTKILVPGDDGAVSNYSRTIRHFYNQYSSDAQRRIFLSERFNFNGYDLTQRCYVARDLSGETANHTPFISPTT